MNVSWAWELPRDTHNQTTDTPAESCPKLGEQNCREIWGEITGAEYVGAAVMVLLTQRSSGGFRLGPERHRPPNLTQAPKFLIGSIGISPSRCCFPNDEGPAPLYFS